MSIFRISILALCLALPEHALAATGYEIAKKSDEATNKGYKGQRATTVMTLYGPDGSVAVRYEMVQLGKEGDGKEGPKAIVRFHAPPDTKGTALLTHEKADSEDDRWLYLSETKQLKRISSANRSASFKGSELSYEDLTASILDRYDWKLLGEKNIDGVAVHEVERTPKFESSGYKRALVYFEKNNYYVTEIRFFDRADQPLKIAKFKGYKQINNQWRPDEIQVVNVQSKRRTTMQLADWKLGLELGDDNFSKAQLQK